MRPAALWQVTNERQESLQNIADCYLNLKSESTIFCRIQSNKGERRAFKFPEYVFFEAHLAACCPAPSVRRPLIWARPLRTETETEIETETERQRREDTESSQLERERDGERERGERERARVGAKEMHARNRHLGNHSGFVVAFSNGILVALSNVCSHDL